MLMHHFPRFVAGALFCSAIALGANSAKADLVAYEPFDYAADSQLNTQAGGEGWTSAWRDGSDNAPIQAGSLTGPAGLPTAGNHALMSGVNGTFTIFRDIPVTGAADGDTTWVTWLGQRVGEAVDPIPDGVDWINNPWPRGTNWGLFAAGDEKIAVGNSSNAVDNEWSLIPEGSGSLRQGSGVPFEQLVWNVMRIDHLGDAATPDNAYLWIDADPLGAAPDTANALAASIGAVDMSSIDSIRPFMGGASAGGGGDRPAGQLLVDEIRIATDWVSATGGVGVPEPTSILLLAGGLLGAVARRRR
jgi:hypothetical protein